MRENNRKPIEKCRKKLPQFTTMNVIDGQAGLVIYSSLIFYSLTIDNILNIIVLLILAGVTIATLIGDNGILTRATEASEETEKQGLKEEIELAVASTKIGEQVDGRNNLREELNKINGATVSKIAEDAYYVERNENGYTVYEDKTIEEGKVDIWDGQTVEKPEVDENNNWHIYTTGQMKFFAKYCNGELTEGENADTNMPEITETTTVYLENNLDMGARQKDGVLTTASETQWTPIDNFKGIFEGNNHNILGIYINNEGYFTGLFADVDIIQNLSIKNSYIKTTNTSLVSLIGAIAGMSSGNITNCHNINTEVDGTVAKPTGGIVGIMYGDEIKDSTNSGKVKGNSYVGGLIGGFDNSGNCVGCVNTGEVIGTDRVGGIAGEIGQGCEVNITKCHNEGKIFGEGTGIGGILGWASHPNTSGTIEKNYNKGEVIGTDKVGGILGRVTSEGFVIKNCYNKGKVTGSGSLGSVIGSHEVTQNNLSDLYYLNTLNTKAINGEDIIDKNILGVSDEINSYQEFLTWIESK